jgi:protein-S-isoprenylcysteine O-methyltransferase Ste14
MKEKFLQQAGRDYSPGKRTIGLMIEGVFFLAILPCILVYFSAQLDQRFRLPHLAFGIINLILGCVLIGTGLLLGWWANYVQFTVGRGTPVPLMATQQLIVQKPYSYCRNPMALGAIVAFLGVAFLIGSISAVVLVLTGAVLLLVYIKLLEEKEMVLRFGEAYQEYKKHTPFIIPRLRQRKQAS